MHVAIASVHKIDYLLTWNFGHLANVRRQARIRHLRVARRAHDRVVLLPHVRSGRIGRWSDVDVHAHLDRGRVVVSRQAGCRLLLKHLHLQVTLCLGLCLPLHVLKSFEGLGALIGPIESKSGWHILKVEQRLPSEVPAFESVKDKLRKDATDDAWQRDYKAYIDRLRKDAFIQINEANVPTA